VSNEKNNSSWTPTNQAYDPNKPMQIGGQAVIEGVMMRAPGSVATAVRRANGAIVVQKMAFQSLIERMKFLNVPILRGAVGLIDMMYLGIKTLNWSAEVAMLDIAPKKQNGSVKKEQSRWSLLLSLTFALVLGLGIFFVLPLFLTTKVFHIEQEALQFNLVSGAIRITILLVYLAAISMMKDVKRLFQYHGAEHKSIFAFELNDTLIPLAVKKHTRFHPRCGTSFLLIVMVVAILTFAVLDSILIRWLGEINLVTRLVTHLPLIPVVGGMSYEVIKFSAKHSTTWWGRIIVAPGLWLQKITTKEPDETQLEVAIVALQCALGVDDASKYPLILVAATSFEA
jgi:uncharacterized protein YqhQ